MIYWCIYQITNKINGKRYIGQHKYYDESNPMKGYRGSGYNLWKAYRKYGFDNFTTEVLYKRILSLDTANAMEIYAIEKYKPEYNITKGGGGVPGLKHTAESKQKNREKHIGFKHTDEAKKKIGEASIRLWSNDEHREHMRAISSGRRVSDETRKRMSEAQKGHTVSDEARRKMSEAKKGKPGKKWTEAQRIKFSNSRRGIEFSREWRDKIGNANRGKKRSEEFKRHLSEISKGKPSNTAGKHWYTNGHINVVAFTCPDGFKPGKLVRSKQ